MSKEVGAGGTLDIFLDSDLSYAGQKKRETVHSSGSNEKR